MWSNGSNRHLNLRMLMYGMCQKTRSETGKKKKKEKKKIPVEPLLLSPTPQKQNEKKKPRRKLLVHLFLRIGSHEKLKNMNKKPQTDKSEGETVKTQQHWAGFNDFLAEWMFRFVPAATLGWGNFISTCFNNNNKSNISLYFPETLLRNETPSVNRPKSLGQLAGDDLPPRVSCAVQAKGVNVLKCASNVLHRAPLRYHTSDRFEAQCVWRWKTKLGRVHQPSLFLAGKRRRSS